MKSQNLSNQSLAGIAEYSMIIDRFELVYWKEKGWKEKEIEDLKGRSKRLAQLFFDYPEKNETLVFNSPLFLKEYECQKLIGRRIWKFSANLGDYGMGGPGFFGLLLDDEEFLTYATWGSGRYVLVDDKAVECGYEFYQSYKPLYANSGGRHSWDKLSPLINGSHIVDYQLEEHQFIIKVKKKSEIHQIRFVRNNELLPCGEEKIAEAYTAGNIGDYILFQHKHATLYV